MLVRFSKEISPFRMVHICHVDIKNHPQLLDFLYYNIVPSYIEEENCGPLEEDKFVDQDDINLNFVRNFTSSTKNSILDHIRTLRSLIIMFLVRIPLQIMNNIPVLSFIKNRVDKLLSSEKEQDSERNNEPLLEEIFIPSVIELISSGIKICPINGGISTVDFCTETVTLHLPIISLDINSEVLLRNLIAYEASFGSKPLVLSRYIEFMNGIIDTEEDARLLRNNGIILNYLKSNKEVAEMWNGMTQSISLTRVQGLDCVIEEIKKFYNSRWKVILKKIFK
jgi:Plant protein of unknown function